MYNVTMVVGNNVRRLRRQRMLTQEQLAEVAGISSDYLSRMELGKENPTVDVLARLAKALESDITELFVVPTVIASNGPAAENAQAANES